MIVRMVIHGERALERPTFYSTVRARRLLHQVCLGFLAYISDMRVDSMIDLGSVSVVRDFRDVFP